MEVLLKIEFCDNEYNCQAKEVYGNDKLLVALVDWFNMKVHPYFVENADKLNGGKDLIFRKSKHSYDVTVDQVSKFVEWQRFDFEHNDYVGQVFKFCELKIDKRFQFNGLVHKIRLETVGNLIGAFPPDAATKYNPNEKNADICYPTDKSHCVLMPLKLDLPNLNWMRSGLKKDNAIRNPTAYSPARGGSDNSKPQEDRKPGPPFFKPIETGSYWPDRMYNYIKAQMAKMGYFVTKDRGDVHGLNSINMSPYGKLYLSPMRNGETFNQEDYYHLGQEEILKEMKLSEVFKFQSPDCAFSTIEIDKLITESKNLYFQCQGAVKLGKSYLAGTSTPKDDNLLSKLLSSTLTRTNVEASIIIKNNNIQKSEKLQASLLALSKPQVFIAKVRLWGYNKTRTEQVRFEIIELYQTGFTIQEMAVVLSDEELRLLCKHMNTTPEDVEPKAKRAAIDDINKVQDDDDDDDEDDVEGKRKHSSSMAASFSAQSGKPRHVQVEEVVNIDMNSASMLPSGEF